MVEYLKAYKEFRTVIEESRIDNRTLVIELGDCLQIKPQDINSMTELMGRPQYHIRYKDILVIMSWNERNMSFEFPDYYGICEGNTLKKLVRI